MSSNDAVDWDVEFERMVKLMETMPPTLLVGLLVHVVKAVYERGCFGYTSTPGGNGFNGLPKTRERVLINGAASKLVQQVEGDLRSGIQYGTHGGGDAAVRGVRVCKSLLPKESQREHF
jgi:hypothetical protein